MVGTFASIDNNGDFLLLKRMADGVDSVPDLLVTGEWRACHACEVGCLIRKGVEGIRMSVALFAFV